MKSSIYIQNLRCGGCATSIRNALSIIHEIKNVDVIPVESKVTFTAKNDSTRLEAILAMKKLVYPLDKDNNTVKDKAKSIISCVIGKLN